jgi:hypothetical protein
MLYYVHKVERDKSRPQEKNLKKFWKTLDKTQNLWYNKYTIKKDR